MPLSLKDIAAPVAFYRGPVRRRQAASTAAAVRMLVAAVAALAAGGCATTDSSGAGGPYAPPKGARFRLPPFVWWDRAPDGRREVRNFLGFLYGQRVETAEPDESSPRDLVVSRDSLNILWPFYHRSLVARADGMRTTTRSLMPFVWSARKSEPSGRGTEYVRRRVMVPPLLFSLRSDNYGSGQLEYEFLWPLGKYFRGERLSRGSGRREMARKFVFRPFVSYERTWPLVERPPGHRPAGAGTPPPAPGAGHPGERVRVRVLKPLFGYDRDADAGRKRGFLLGGITEWGGGEGQRTLGLLAAEKGPATDYEIQALWQFFMVKRSGSGDLASRAFAAERPSDMWRATRWLFGGSPRKQFRLGPLVNYEADWSADRKEFSLLFGLVSYFREGGHRRGRFLWVIPWRP